MRQVYTADREADILALLFSRLMRLGRALAQLPADLLLQTDEWKAAAYMLQQEVSPQEDSAAA